MELRKAQSGTVIIISADIMKYLGGALPAKTKNPQNITSWHSVHRSSACERLGVSCLRRQLKVYIPATEHFFLFPSIIFNINNTFISKHENMFCWVSIFSKINTFGFYFHFGYFGEWWILNRADFRLSSVIILKPETCQLFLPTFVLTWCHYSSILGNGISLITWWIIGALF